MATVHLICGPTGSGKTTYSHRLAQELGCARFAIDDWMATLFFPDSPPRLQWDWVRTRVERCEHQIWCVCRQLLELGQDVVLDLGLPKRHHRDRFSVRAAEASAELKLHVIEADREVRKARVLERNHSHTDIFGFRVTEEMFDYMESVFEPPTGTELESAQVISTDAA